jgi:hypothetical protein
MPMRFGRVREFHPSADASGTHFSLENRPNWQRPAIDDRLEIHPSEVVNDRA